MSEFLILVGTGKITSKIKRHVTKRGNSAVPRQFSLIQDNSVGQGLNWGIIDCILSRSPIRFFAVTVIHSESTIQVPPRVYPFLFPPFPSNLNWHRFLLRADGLQARHDSVHSLPPLLRSRTEPKRKKREKKKTQLAQKSKIPQICTESCHCFCSCTSPPS